MNIHEYQAKQLLRKYDIPVPEGYIAKTPNEAVISANKLGGENWAIKAQVHAGGRGKAGGVKLAASMDEVESALSWENLEGVMVRAYASVFTRAEVENLNQMFQSPAGQAYVAKQSDLQAATMREMETIMIDLMPRIQKKTQAAIERAKNGSNAQN